MLAGWMSYATAQSPVLGTIDIQTREGHPIPLGASGFNVRIADKIWNYNHPDFREAVHALKPGWLRYFSGTMGDAFSSATGMYDLDYAMMFDHDSQYLKGYRYTAVKGPHRLADLYQLLGEINGRLIITANAFTETPDIVRELARFCRNNHIEVATWQFCNEPYFYVPHRNRYWWNDGYDYAAKMKPYADAIRSVDPAAHLTLNCTWDGIWGFMKDIHRYQEEHGAYWDVFSKHSYAPHTGKQETIEAAYRRANTKLLEATGTAAMEAIEAYSWDDIPMVITEFGVWNRPLNGIYSSIYNIEYVLRQLAHSNARYIGAHEVSSKYRPETPWNQRIEQAFVTGEKLQTDSLRTGIRKTLEGKAYEIFHEVTSQSNFVMNTSLEGGVQVPGLDENPEEGLYAQAFKGVAGYEYLVITNRSDREHQFVLTKDQKAIDQALTGRQITGGKLTTVDAEIDTVHFDSNEIAVPPFSLTVLKWATSPTLPIAPRIYGVSAGKHEVRLNWGPVPGAAAYRVRYGKKPDALDQILAIKGDQLEVTVPGLEADRPYYFVLESLNRVGSSRTSPLVRAATSVPEAPEIFKTARRNQTVTIWWRSVANADGYRVRVEDEQNSLLREVDAGNVFAYRLDGLTYGDRYRIRVEAYNRAGAGNPSEPVRVQPLPGIPYSPRNASAKAQIDGSALIQWMETDSLKPDTRYRLYRGEKLDDLNLLAENIQDTFFRDRHIQPDQLYYYTVKAYTNEGESNFHPNIATLIHLPKDHLLQISSLEKTASGDWKARVEFENIILGGNISAGIYLSDISYLNVEEIPVRAQNVSQNRGTFEVVIPREQLKKGSRYRLKPFIRSDKQQYTGSLSDRVLSR